MAQDAEIIKGACKVRKLHDQWFPMLVADIAPAAYVAADLIGALTSAWFFAADKVAREMLHTRQALDLLGSRR